MCQLPENAELYLDGSRGQYIPQNFIEITKPECINENGIISPWTDWKEILLAGPDHEFYWDVWIDVCDTVTITDPTIDVEFNLYQDGDLWIIPVDAEWPET